VSLSRVKRSPRSPRICLVSTRCSGEAARARIACRGDAASSTIWPWPQNRCGRFRRRVQTCCPLRQAMIDQPGSSGRSSRLIPLPGSGPPPRDQVPDAQIKLRLPGVPWAIGPVSSALPSLPCQAMIFQVSASTAEESITAYALGSASPSWCGPSARSLRAPADPLCGVGTPVHAREAWGLALVAWSLGVSAAAATAGVAAGCGQQRVAGACLPGCVQASAPLGPGDVGGWRSAIALALGIAPSRGVDRQRCLLAGRLCSPHPVLGSLALAYLVRELGGNPAAVTSRANHAASDLAVVLSWTMARPCSGSPLPGCRP